MAGLGKGLKALAGSVTPPKKDINPLLKQMEEAFTSPDLDLFDKDPNAETELVGRFYSPVYSTIEKMPIGKEGTKGENIMGYLNKRAPNVDKSELESFNINLDPNKKYTREEVLTLAKEKGSSDYTIEKQKYTEYEDTQRQNVSDKEVEYAELVLQGKQDYTRHSNKTHFGGKKNIGHSRVSIREEMPEGGPLSQKIVDRPRYLLIEELQSDLAKVRDDLPNEESPITNYYNQGSPFDPNIDIEQFNREVFYPKISGNFDDLVEELNDLFNIYVDRNVVNTIKDFYLTTFDPELIDSIDDFKKINQDDTYKNQLIKTLKDEHNIDAAGRDIETVSLDAIRKKSDTSSGETDWSSGGDYELSPDEVLEREVKRVVQSTKAFIDNLYLAGAPKSQLNLEEIQTLPVATRTEYVKRLLLANIAYAKQNNINKIVIPNYKEIASQRVDTFDAVLYDRGMDETDPLVQKYKKALEKGKEVEVAQEYFEGVFKPIYEDAVKKVLNGLKAETKSAIKTSTKELKYPDLTKPDRFRKSNALEIDITEFDYDPATSIFRFAEGGAVPMEEQMKLFEQGGLRDEGGMVDEVSGNDVPIGSTRKEVRDDIPAMLSEGEFVFPADVVRFLGLERLMNLRQEAKMGLKQMEAMGQMGNSDEATMPDDLPFGMMDLIIVEGEEEEPEEKAHGGVIHAQQGTFVTPIFDPQNQDVRPYTNDGGQTVRYIPFLGGQPVYPIPEGYVPLDQATALETEETPEAIPTDDDDPRPPVEPSEFQKAGGWNMDFGDPPDPNKVELWIKEAEKVSTVGNVVSGVLAAVNPVLGVFNAVGTHLNKKGITNNYERVLKAASKTPIKGQMDRIEKVNKRLTDPESKGILGGIVGEIIDGISGAVGLTPEETAIAKNVGNTSITTPIETDPNKFELDLKESLRPVSKPEELKDIGIRGNTLNAQEAEVLRKAGIDITRVDPTEARRALALASIDSPISSDKTIQNLKKYKNKIEKPITSDTAIPPSVSSSLSPPTVEKQTEETLLPPDRTGADTIRGVIPTDTAAFAAKPEQVTGGLGEVKTRADDRQTFELTTANEKLRKALQAIRSADTVNSLVERGTDAKNKGLQQLAKNAEEAIESIVSGNEASGLDDKGPMRFASATQQNAVSLEPQKPKRVGMQSKDDDGPSLAERMQKTMQEQATKSLDTFDKNVGEVVSKAKTKSAQKAAKQEAKKVKEKLEQQAKGIKTGFKKGGLASRKK
jgi:hypothetical protein